MYLVGPDRLGAQVWKTDTAAPRLEQHAAMAHALVHVRVKQHTPGRARRKIVFILLLEGGVIDLHHVFDLVADAIEVLLPDLPPPAALEDVALILDRLLLIERFPG